MRPSRHYAPSRRDVVAGSLAAAAVLALPVPAFARSVAKSGARELLTFTDGTINLPISMAASDRKPEEVAAVLKAGGLPTDRNAAPLNVTAVKDGENCILLDAGSGQRFLPGSGKLGESLEAAGIDREKITHVLFTHAHPDHLWGAVDEFDEPAFPNAKYLIAQTDRDYWMAPATLNKVPEPLKMFVAGAQRVIKTLGDRLGVFKAGAEIAPGIAAFDTGGHTPGHVSFEVKMGSDSIMVLGDALTHPLISFSHPDWKPGSDSEPDRAIATRKRLLDRLASEKRRLIGYHLPGGGAGRAEKAGSAWRFVPG